MLLQSHSWSEFHSRLASLGTKEKGDAFELLTKLFLQLDPIYATKPRQVWLLRDVPMKVRAQLALPDTDQGIDLIAETHDREFWAVQSKYRDSADASLSWREVSTFTGLTFGICRKISYSLIAFSGDRYADLLKDGERIGFLASDTWHALGEEFFARAQTGRALAAAARGAHHPRGCAVLGADAPDAPGVAA